MPASKQEGMLGLFCVVPYFAVNTVCLGSNVYMNLSSNRSGQAKCYNEGTKCCNEYRATA